MIYAQIKTPEEMEKLEEELGRAKNAKWYRRLIIISHSARGERVSQLSEKFGVCQATIRSYIHAYNEGGLQQLRPKKSPGRPPKIGHWSKEDWDTILRQTPNQYEKLETESRQWSLHLLSLYIKRYHDIDVSLSGVYRCLRKRGRRTGRSKLRVGSPDPQYKVKRQQIEKLRDFPRIGVSDLSWVSVSPDL